MTVNINCSNSTFEIEAVDIDPVDIKAVFTSNGCVGKSLKYSVFGGIGAIALLLLVVLVLMIAICCFASKLWKIKRYTINYG